MPIFPWQTSRHHQPPPLCHWSLLPPHFIQQHHKISTTPTLTHLMHLHDMMSSTMTKEHFQTDRILLSNVVDSPKSSDQKQQHLPSQRRRLKSALFFAYRPSSIATVLLFLTTLFSHHHYAAQAFSTVDQSGFSQRKHEWIKSSVDYYSTVMRKNNEKTTKMMDSASAGGMEHYDPLNDKNF
eukprot:scaffold16352_cov79-Skeletonema_dohrnii-CCMP3373.AAC.1